MASKDLANGDEGTIRHATNELMLATADFQQKLKDSRLDTAGNLGTITTEIGNLLDDALRVVQRATHLELEYIKLCGETRAAPEAAPSAEETTKMRAALEEAPTAEESREKRAEFKGADSALTAHDIAAAVVTSLKIPTAEDIAAIVKKEVASELARTSAPPKVISRLRIGVDSDQEIEAATSATLSISTHSGRNSPIGTIASSPNSPVRTINRARALAPVRRLPQTGETGSKPEPNSPTRITNQPAKHPVRNITASKPNKAIRTARYNRSDNSTRAGPRFFAGGLRPEPTLTDSELEPDSPNRKSTSSAKHPMQIATNSKPKDPIPSATNSKPNDPIRTNDFFKPLGDIPVRAIRNSEPPFFSPYFTGSKTPAPDSSECKQS